MTALGITFTIIGIIFIVMSLILVPTFGIDGAGLALVLFFAGCAMYLVPILVQQKPYETILFIPVVIMVTPVLVVLALILCAYLMFKLIIILSE